MMSRSTRTRFRTFLQSPCIAFAIAVAAYTGLGFSSICCAETRSHRHGAADEDFGGCFSCREKFTGNWFGVRPCLADTGVTFDADVIQFYQGVAHGGTRETFNYGGHGDYLLGLDFGKLVGWQGLSLQLRGEHRFGEYLASDAGLIAPADFHAASPSIETEEVLLTNVLFTQVVSENLTILFGKLDTLDGDRNPFASGRGKTQFFNTSLIEPVLVIPTVPFATLGAGAVFSVDGMPAAQLLVLNATDTTTTSGFSELFEDGVAILGGVNVPVPIAGKMGIHSFNGAWNSKTFTSLGQDPRAIGGNAPLATSEGSWALWWSGAQYLYQDRRDPMKGWGLFGRFGVSDGDTNPIQYFANAGIGGQSPFRGREGDLFGIGWFYNRFSSSIGAPAVAQLALEEAATGVEIYYNYALTPYCLVTPDLQVIEPGTSNASTALLLGLRVQIDF